jgi:hypothetical protein
MTKSEARGNGTQASVHLVSQGKGGVDKSLVFAILAQYFRRSLSTSFPQPKSNYISRVGALSDALGARQRGDCVALTEGQVLENQHDSHNTRSDEGALPTVSRERPANDRRIQNACKALVPESLKRILSPGAGSR